MSAPKLITRKDGGGQLGGKIIQDKLWFFADLRYRQVIREIPFATRPDGSIIHRPQHQFFQAYKLSGQLNQTNKLIAFWHRYGDHEKRSASQFVPERAMEQNNAWGETWKAEWQATIGQSLTLSVQHGRFEHVNQYTGFAPGIPRSIDITTLMEDGDAVSDGRYSTNGQIHDRAVLSWYRPDLLAGNHAFTFGLDFLDGGNGATNPPRRSGDYRLRFNNSAPFQIDIYNVPNAPELRTRYLAGYVQDSWTINRRLTLSIGLRGPARPRVGSGAVSKARHVRRGVSRELQRGSSAEHFQFLHAARACRLRRDRRWPFGDQRRLRTLRASPLDRG